MAGAYHGGSVAGMAFDLVAAAVATMRQNGFEPDFSPAIRREVEALGKSPLAANDVRDLRDWLWSSIDNYDSRDLDQIEYARPKKSGEIEVFVGIADVDSKVGKASAINARAGENCTSVYTGVTTFPMLPEQLSTDLTSLNFQQDRVAVVVSYAVREDGTLGES